MNIFTISKFRYPKHVEDTFSNYTFFYEDDHTYLNYFKQNTIIDLSYNVFAEIKNVYIKKMCFALYALYFRGGFFY